MWLKNNHTLCTMTFGALLKTIRLGKALTLRQCCEQLRADPSNWSKLERGVNPAPHDIAVLEKWAVFFGLDASARLDFFDAAAISRREIPIDLASDEVTIAALPVFFRAARKATLTEEQISALIEDVRRAHSPDKNA